MLVWCASWSLGGLLCGVPAIFVQPYTADTCDELYIMKCSIVIFFFGVLLSFIIASQLIA